MTSAFDVLKARADQWGVTITDPWETTGSALAFGTCNGKRVVLKISKQHGDEWHAGETLRAFAGHSTVRVYASEPGAVLLERLEPGHQLVDLVRTGKDEAATEILAQVISAMAHCEPPAQCTVVEDWFAGFDRYVQTGDQQIPRDLVTEARQLFKTLAASQGPRMLLHGDLQHYNVLFDANRGWVAIDPKGVVGELEYEMGAILRNPVGYPDVFASISTIERRVEFLVNQLSLNFERVLGWTFAQAVLSAIWEIEDGQPGPSTDFAAKLRRLVESA